MATKDTTKPAEGTGTTTPTEGNNNNSGNTNTGNGNTGTTTPSTPTTDENAVKVNLENPFAYSHLDEVTYDSFATQRKATYFKATPNSYNSTDRDAFFNNVEVGTPNIARINGIPEEVEDTTTDSGNNNGSGNTGNNSGNATTSKLAKK